MRKFTVTIVFIFCSFFASSQPGPPKPGGGTSPTPLGFVEVLLVGGAIIGGRKLLEDNKEN